MLRCAHQFWLYMLQLEINSHALWFLLKIKDPVLGFQHLKSEQTYFTRASC